MTARKPAATPAETAPSDTFVPEFVPTFEEAEVPAEETGAGRPAEPNPFTEALTTLPWDETAKKSAKSRVIRNVPPAILPKLRRQATAAALALGKSPRFKIEHADNDKGKPATVTVWLVPQIKRPRKATPTPATEAATDQATPEPSAPATE